MADSDLVDIRARLRGGQQVRSEAGGMASSIVRIGWAGHQAARGLGTLSGAARGFGNTITSWRSAAVIGTIGYATKSLVGLGLQFNATQEQSQVAFTQFLGGSQAARRELVFLQHTAARTPFELPQITTAERRLLAFGFGLKESNRWLNTIGDTIAGMGGGAQEIDQLVTAIGQIRSKGRLQGDELMQLSELGVVNRQRLAKDLGITPLELMSGNANISAQRALKALQKQFDATFGGQSAKQARTFNGQLSTLHDNLSQTLGVLTRPGFDWLEHSVFPQLDRATTDVTKQLAKHKGLSPADQLQLAWTTARHDLTPLTHALERDLKNAHLDQRFYDLIDWATPKMADAAGDAAPKVAVAFVTGWWHAGAWGKLITAGFLLSKLGAFRIAGTAAGEMFAARFAIAAATGEAAGAAGAGGRGRAGKYAPWLLNPYTAAAAAAAYGSGVLDPATAGLSPAVERARIRAAQRRLHGRVDSSVGYFRGHPGALSPDIINALTSRQISALAPEIALYINHHGKRLLARGVAKTAADAIARKGR